MEQKRLSLQEERKKFVEDWTAIAKAFLPDLPEEEIAKRVKEAEEMHFSSKASNEDWVV